MSRSTGGKAGNHFIDIAPDLRKRARIQESGGTRSFIGIGTQESVRSPLIMRKSEFKLAGGHARPVFKIQC